jgi:hypothetical protein
MKMLIATAALATLVTSSALAQTLWRAEPPPYLSYGQVWVAPGQAYAQQIQPYAFIYYYGRSPNPAWDVYDIRGGYVGSDPDPRVRSHLARDPTPGD